MIKVYRRPPPHPKRKKRQAHACHPTYVRHDGRVVLSAGEYENQLYNFSKPRCLEFLLTTEVSTAFNSFQRLITQIKILCHNHFLIITQKLICQFGLGQTLLCYLLAFFEPRKEPSKGECQG